MINYQQLSKAAAEVKLNIIIDLNIVYIRMKWFKGHN